MAAESANKPSKRRLRNAETIRERALKAQEEADKPGRAEVFKSRTSAVADRPARLFTKVTSLPPLKWLRKPLRIVGRVVLPKYFRNSWKELRLVAWPDRRKSRQLTTAVIVFALGFSAIVSAVDYGLDKLFREVLLK